MQIKNRSGEVLLETPGADLEGADLTGADLTGADLIWADLRGAHLTGAHLRGADLRGADLRGAVLTGADLAAIKEDLYRVLSASPNEVEGLLTTLREGRIDGSTYEGACACLVGTIANVKGCDYRAVPGIKPDSNRPAERWFLAIRKGDTPPNSPAASITEGWIVEWLATRPQETRE